ncbi:glycosyltransferase [Candidatus Woesearchaeota archaeon]|jgi:glycogen synthase|nr:glycosyltransferase [Candidatus Woesearchaeota archaeon]MBT3538325.1 glycosyltransferase [Candidatus Woesearchaeota archaeon]MBT4698302.1 glycosyltransferase [Candidatus Woesearchaeota archaeon]MBT4716799.1 glycosyltransferase [Candidatus Woesearchaeota archaeon]MBT7105994.1 glycosyltransferase [Candidatus Woesearchaeota archaeon]
MGDKADYLFEASWEVCNKVGGIFTVVKSKAALINDNYQNYFLIGPYFKEKADTSFESDTVPLEFEKVFQDLAKEGITCHYGKWLIKGEPKTILIDSSGLADKKNDLKSLYWDKFQVDSLNSGWDFEEPLVWATAVGKLIEGFVNVRDGNKKVVGHFHEWLAGFALLYLKLNNVQCGTVFTTHATMLGRTIAGAGRDLYDSLDQINPEEEAKNSGIMDKFSTEKACAHNADAFTTVSEITGLEAEKLLGRKPDVLLLNGLDIDKFPTFEETSVMHRKNRDIIREFISYYFFPYYYFDIEESLNLFIVGRYEYKNKGLDIFIKALAKLNEALKAEKSKKTIVAFFWIPRDVHGAKMDLSLNKISYNRIRNYVTEKQSAVFDRIVRNVMACDSEDLCDPLAFGKTVPVFDKEFLTAAKKLRMSFVKQGNPHLVTHNISNEDQDPIINAFLENGLDNKEDDNVKVIFYPVYLTGVDGLIDLPYYEAITGCHMGLFPSYYEPWGYTPLESAALGVPSLTTDLGGFGRFIQEKADTTSGIYVLKRFHVPEEESIQHFFEILHNFTKLNQKGRVEEKMKAKQLAHLADWKVLVHNYFDAHSLAIEKAYKN